MASEKRDLRIDTLRGIVIILMVISHVIGTTSNDGLKVTEDSIYRWFYCLIENYFLPIFMAISGYVYAVKPLNRLKIKSFIKAKIGRIVYPLIFVSTTQFLVRYITPGTNTKPILSNIWKIYVYSYDQFWYLQAFILILILVVFLEYFNLIDSFMKLSICFGILFIGPFILKFRTAIFSFNGFLYLASFFIMGIILYRYKDNINSNKVKIISICLFIITILIQQLIYFDKNVSMVRTDFIGVLFGVIGIIFSFSIVKAEKYMAWLGNYAFDIYLFHVFGQAGSRIVLKALGVNNTLFLFIINLIFGLFIPIVMAKVLEKNSITKKYLLGLK
jgi:glucans biosynthesis protein C